jgi:hypothetical protein
LPGSKELIFKKQKTSAASRERDGALESSRGPLIKFTTLGRAIRVPDDFFLDPGDAVYLSYYLEKFDEVFSLGILGAKSPLWNLFCRALEHLPLRYTLIAVSAWLFDGIGGRSRERSIANLRKAIPMIQEAVGSTLLDEGHGIAVFLLVYLSIVRGDVRGISLHTNGFYRILRYCNVLKEDGTPTHNHSALSMVLWRIAIRAENIGGFAGPRAAFPVTNVPDSFHLQWLHELESPERPNSTAWALAQFNLDDLANRTIHLATRSLEIQRALARGETDGIDELNLQLDTIFLVRDLEAWKCRPVLREAESRERIRRTSSPAQPGLRFLDHEQLTFEDEVYAIMLVQYFTIRIQVSLISSPKPGPHPKDRYMFAIELCRVYAAIGGIKRPGLSGLLVGLFYAGLTLTDKTYPLGI